MQTFTVDIRPKRQTTLPRELLAQLGVEVGDSFKAYVESGKFILVPQKRVALDAFSELKKIVSESKISENQIQYSEEPFKNIEFLFKNIIGAAQGASTSYDPKTTGFLNNIFIDSPQILLKSLKEDFAKAIDKTGKTLVIIFNEFDIVSQNLNIDLLTRNLVALRNTARFNIIYIFTLLHPVTLNYSFYKKVIWMTPFKNADALGVVDRNALRYKVALSDKQKNEIIKLTGGHAGMIKFIIQNLSEVESDNINGKIYRIEKSGDICLQCDRLLSPLTDIEKSKLKNNQRDELLVNLGLQTKSDGKTKIFSPILGNYLKNKKGCVPPFCLDRENNEIYLFGKPVTKELALKEFVLLKLLIGSPNKIFKRDEIMEKVWGEEEFPSDWAFDKLISRLRKKLINVYEGNYLVVHKGIGVSLN